MSLSIEHRDPQLDGLYQAEPWYQVQIQVASCLLPPASCLLPPASCLLPGHQREEARLVLSAGEVVQDPVACPLRGAGHPLCGGSCPRCHRRRPVQGQEWAEDSVQQQLRAPQ